MGHKHQACFTATSYQSGFRLAIRVYRKEGKQGGCVSVPRGTYVLSHRFEAPLPNAIRNACCMALKVEVRRFPMQAVLFKSKLSISR
jgi:hypothetical protein